MPIVSSKFYIKYIKIVNNVIQIKRYLKINIFYFKNIFNIEFWIINESNQKKQKSNIEIIIELKRRKR